MEAWQKQLAAAITEPGEIAERFGVDVEPLRGVVARYPLRITPHYFSLIEAPGDPIWRQCIPDPRELHDDLQDPDPLNEESLSPVPGLIHRYPDRVVLLVSNACAMYCRFCMRKRQVGCGSQKIDLSAALDYIAETPAIRDVILSGGDPFLLPDDELADLLARLRSLSNVEMIRIGSRVPVTLPSRITPRLCRLLKRFHPLYLNTHFNHPRELTPQSTIACRRLADAGIPLGNQTVLLQGVNDEPGVMKKLMQGLLAMRVRPYYIHQLDLVRGTGHFRTSVRRGLEVMEGLRGHTSGLATPYYVIDLPGGKGKVPLVPDNGEWRGNRLLLRNYQGEIIEYEDTDSGR
ncbi:KamA family radical SAM protein [Geobacter sp. AOG1]|uniref:KamA family radical SAM protein n=1 Tax=Geobacter sp. AOG1 TaxID=1566346 RepID=UPI001CC78868|nr:KamA family radical SAM protein [Geobacter sp. AOG1]GFE58543.1 lysine 2,3-aminomutase [Geobacter sp. AOG1]